MSVLIHECENCGATSIFVKAAVAPVGWINCKNCGQLVKANYLVKPQVGEGNHPGSTQTF